MKIISKQQIVGLLDSSFVPDFPELGVMGRILTLQPRYQVVREAFIKKNHFLIDIRGLERASSIKKTIAKIP